MKVVKFIYQESEISFISSENDVMVNATQMAKKFNKEPKDFLRLNGTKKYIKVLFNSLNIEADVPRYNQKNIVNSNNKAGTFMHRKLALKFAAWLDVEFELWIFDTIDNLIFGNYKKHWEAHAQQEQAKIEMEKLKKQMLINPTIEKVHAYFKQERNLKQAKSNKTKAIKKQLNLFQL